MPHQDDRREAQHGSLQPHSLRRRAPHGQLEARDRRRSRRARSAATGSVARARQYSPRTNTVPSGPSAVVARAHHAEQLAHARRLRRARACARPRRRRGAPKSAEHRRPPGTSTDQKSTSRSRDLGPVEEHRAAEQEARRGRPRRAPRRSRRTPPPTSSASPRHEEQEPEPGERQDLHRHQREHQADAADDARRDEPGLVELDVEAEHAGHEQQHRHVRVDEHVQERVRSAIGISRAGDAAIASATRSPPSWTSRPSIFFSRSRAVAWRRGRSREAQRLLGRHRHRLAHRLHRPLDVAVALASRSTR